LDGPLTLILIATFSKIFYSMRHPVPLPTAADMVAATEGVSDEQTFQAKKKAATIGDIKQAVAPTRIATNGSNCVVSETSGIASP
jgi:hypothetical protein